MMMLKIMFFFFEVLGCGRSTQTRHHGVERSGDEQTNVSQDGFMACQEQEVGLSCAYGNKKST